MVSTEKTEKEFHAFEAKKNRASEQDQIQKLTAENKKLVEALEWYTDKMERHGDSAQKVLAELENERP